MTGDQSASGQGKGYDHLRDHNQAQDSFAAILTAVVKALSETKLMLSALEIALLDREADQGARVGSPDQPPAGMSQPLKAGLQNIDRISQRLEDLTTILGLLSAGVAGIPLPLSRARLASRVRLAEIRTLFEAEDHPEMTKCRPEPILF